MVGSGRPVAAMTARPAASSGGRSCSAWPGRRGRGRPRARGAQRSRRRRRACPGLGRGAHGGDADVDALAALAVEVGDVAGGGVDVVEVAAGPVVGGADVDEAGAVAVEDAEPLPDERRARRWLRAAAMIVIYVPFWSGPAPPPGEVGAGLAVCGREASEQAPWRQNGMALAGQAGPHGRVGCHGGGGPRARLGGRGAEDTCRVGVGPAAVSAAGGRGLLRSEPWMAYCCGAAAGCGGLGGLRRAAWPPLPSRLPGSTAGRLVVGGELERAAGLAGAAGALYGDAAADGEPGGPGPLARRRDRRHHPGRDVQLALAVVERLAGSRRSV
jgi:hypothetical protein